MAYRDFKEAHPNEHPQLWPAYAAERGYPTKVSTVKSESEYDSDIFTQLIMALITLPIGVYFLVKLLRENNRWVAMDEDGFHANGGVHAPWSSLTSSTMSAGSRKASPTCTTTTRTRLAGNGGSCSTTSRANANPSSRWSTRPRPT